jgi:uncharacterized membrane protein
MLGVWSWFTFWLIGHILTVIVAFGPTFAFPGIAAMARKDPAHAVAFTRVIDFIEHRMTIPLAVLVPLFGTGLIYSAHIDLWKSGWLVASIIIFIFAFFFALLVQSPNSKKMLHMMEQMPPGPPPPGAQPPAEMLALGKRLQFGGMYLTVSVVVLVVLMIWRPGNHITGF